MNIFKSCNYIANIFTTRSILSITLVYCIICKEMVMAEFTFWSPRSRIVFASATQACNNEWLPCVSCILCTTSTYRTILLGLTPRIPVVPGLHVIPFSNVFPHTDMTIRGDFDGCHARTKQWSNVWSTRWLLLSSLSIWKGSHILSFLHFCLCVLNTSRSYRIRVLFIISLAL